MLHNHIRVAVLKQKKVQVNNTGGIILLIPFHRM